MSTAVSINGALVAPENATVSVFDRGFLYADGVFETMRTYAGEPFAMEEHLGRLARSAAIVDLPLPVTVAELRDEIERTMAAGANAESYVRLMLTRGEGELGLDPKLAAGRPTRVVIVRPLGQQPREIYVDGVALASVPTRRDTGPASGSGAKGLGYLANMLAYRMARSAGAYDAVLIDGSTVLESTTANVFVVERGRIATPWAADGILGGITREHVLDVARGAAMVCEERRVDASELWTADEIFITSTLREIVPVVRVDAHEVGDARPGPVTRELHRRFRARTRLAGTPLPWE